jgi:hypothetical protein
MGLDGYYDDKSRIPFPDVTLEHRGGGVPFIINCDNSWEHDNGPGRDWDTCSFQNGDVPMVLYHGEFYWFIPLKWRIAGSGADWKLMTSYLQEFKVTDDGTMTVKKFGKQVERSMWE